MTRLRFAWLAGLALLACGSVALPAMASKAVSTQPGTFTAIDDGKLFTSAGLDKAKAAMNDAHFEHGLSVTIETFDSIPANKKLPAGEDEKKKFFHDWAMQQSKGAKGIFILVCRHPGYVEVIRDEQTRERGFSDADRSKLHDMLLQGFRDSAKESDPAKQLEMRDAALQSAIGFVVSDLQGTHVGSGHSSPAEKPGKAGGGMLGGIGGLLCLGVVVLLCVWLVIGVIRAFTGGGGGGGYGGGGGGFMSSLFGGLFGAMAGMWLYNSMFGHGGMFGGSDAYASDGMGGGDVGDTGAGDFSGDAGSGGGWDDGGGGFGGGGDWGGGGGDLGGGGDF